MSACSPCLRRAGLLKALVPAITRALRSGEKRTSALLALGDEELIEAVAADERERLAADMHAFRASIARRRLDDLGIDALCCHDGEYPERLRNLRDRPTVVFSRAPSGRLAELLAAPRVAIVGARDCSVYAAEVAESLGRGLSSAGVTVVSGLARGVDAAAHRGAVAAGTNAIAVLGSGVERPYPRQNSGLYDVLCVEGAVISELPPGSRAARWTFPARNRIMAALADLVIVVEAAEGSGSLITATFATELGRDVAAVPGKITHAVARGSNALIADGARPILSVRDALDQIHGVEPGASACDPAESLEPRLRTVLAAVERTDELRAVEGFSAKELRAALGRLETLGVLRRDGFGGYERTVWA